MSKDPTNSIKVLKEKSTKASTCTVISLHHSTSYLKIEGDQHARGRQGEVTPFTPRMKCGSGIFGSIFSDH